jgi:death-on-curing protein
MEKVTVEEALLTAEVVLNSSTNELLRVTDVSSLESALAAPFATFADVDFYPEFHVKAALYCSRIVRNHPFLDGNKRTAYMVMLVFIAKNNYVWNFNGQDEIADTIIALAARDIDEHEFIDWVGQRLS